VAEIWAEFFKFEKIGKEDNFFELGGDSLKAMRLFAILHKEFGIRIGIKEVFKRPTVSLISEYLSENLEEVII